MEELKKNIVLQATLGSAGTCKDGSLRLTFRTQELQPESKLSVFEFQNKFGWLVFSASKIQEADMPKFKAVEKSDRTPSERLRNTLYRLWEKVDTSETFDTFYARKMEQLIDFVKGKLN